MILVVVNLDPHHTQAGWVSVALSEFKLGVDEAYSVQDLLTDARYVWHGSRNFVQLDPSILPAHIFRVHPIGYHLQYPATPPSIVSKPHQESSVLLSQAENLW